MKRMLLILSLAFQFFAALVISQAATASYTFNQTISSGPGIGVFVNRLFSVTFTFTDLPTIIGDGLLTVTATGDIGGIQEWIRVDTFNGTQLGFVFGDNVSGAEPVTVTDSLLIPLSSLTSAIQGGMLALTFVVEPTYPTAYATFDSLTFMAQAIPEPEIYAMMMVGLGLLGWVGRRNKLKKVVAT